MESILKILIGAVAVALIIGISGVPAMASPRLGIMGIDSGMMAGGMMGAGMMQGMMNGNFDMNDMHERMHSASNFDMNAMHRAMHGKEPDVDMNAMHQRMVSGNLTGEDFKEMKEHCQMMK